MSRPLPPLKGHLRRKMADAPEKSAESKTPPLPDNPYKRFFTENRSFEELIPKPSPLGEGGAAAPDAGRSYRSHHFTG